MPITSEEHAGGRVISVRLPQAMADAVEEMSEISDIDNISEAVRLLIGFGLEHRMNFQNGLVEALKFNYKAQAMARLDQLVQSVAATFMEDKDIDAYNEWLKEEFGPDAIYVDNEEG